MDLPCATADNIGTGHYFFHRKPDEVHPAAEDVSVQDGLLAACAELTGVTL